MAEETQKVAEEVKVEAPVQEAPKAEAPAKKTSLNASVAPENFDWDAFEGGSEIYGGEDKKSIEDAYDQTLSKIVENEVVEGTVTAISKREVIVNIGYKSEGVIQAPEFRYNPDLKVGDKVEVYVESAEDKKGQLILSHKKARALKSWDRVNEAFNNDEIVKGFVKTRTKGGMIVDVFGIEAFLPGSQIDIKPIRDYDAFVNQTMDFKIVKINQEFRNVVVSHKALLEAEQEQRRAELISKLEKGQILEGTVKNITNYGVFVDLGGVDVSSTSPICPGAGSTTLRRLFPSTRRSRSLSRSSILSRRESPLATSSLPLILGTTSTPTSRKATLSRVRWFSSPTTALSSRSSRAWRVLSTCPRCLGLQDSTARRSSSR